MKAYILEGKNQASWRDIPIPEIGSYDALVRVTAVATCTTDVHQIQTASLPTLIGKALGHEAVVVVDSVGDQVKDFKPATPVLHGWDQLEIGLKLMQSRNPDVIKPVILID